MRMPTSESAGAAIAASYADSGALLERAAIQSPSIRLSGAKADASGARGRMRSPGICGLKGGFAPFEFLGGQRRPCESQV